MNFHIVILSKSPGNFIACLKGLFLRQSALDPSQIIVVDDGLGEGARKLFPKVRYLDPPKPFIFSRNVNLAAKAAESDIMLIGDDVVLESPDGLSSLSKAVRIREDIGVCSPAIIGTAHPHQAHQRTPQSLRVVDKNLAFVSVYIKRSTFATVGYMDESFVGYGYDDDDYCVRVRNAGLHTAVYDNCIVTHRIEMSCFRKINNEKFMQMYRDNEKLYREKWKI